MKPKHMRCVLFVTSFGNGFFNSGDLKDFQISGRIKPLASALLAGSSAPELPSYARAYMYLPSLR